MELQGVLSGHRTVLQLADAPRSVAADQFHRVVMRVFAQKLPGADPRAESRILGRVEGGRILVQSTVAPTRPAPGVVIESTRAWSPPRYRSPVQVRVRLAAETNLLGGPQFLPEAVRKPRSRRPVPPRDRLDWALERLTRRGLLFQTLPDTETGDLAFDAVQRPPIPWIDVRGTALITNAEALRDAVWNGVGRGKAYGLGLLDIDPEAWGVPD